ncbi:protein LIFEGUARD 4-like [Eucalyptus grandis]|uniref:protein LIFEGUARD 4-like n=1 Tax=Eucalyptus grandis TaxID=71139 RepID=UPI00192EFF8B|nr:protein LIFEGUARD 4-like [Eucalyptus grandis]
MKSKTGDVENRGGDIENRRDGDNESGRDATALYPNMLESPQLRWAFIRKVYVIILAQLLLTVGIASAVFLAKPMKRFVAETKLGSAIFIVLLVLPLILICPLRAYHKRHPVNFVLLGLFTVTMAFGLCFSCAFTKEKIILESAILTSVVVVALTLYTFWAVKRGHDFSFLGPFLFASLLVIIVFALIQIFFPLGKLSWMIFGCLGSIVFAAFIVYDTNNLIKRFSYDEYIWAAVSIYLDVINLFLSLLYVFGAGDG